MQQAFIDFTAQNAQARVNLAERVRELGKVVNLWLDSKSNFYSRIASMTVTRRTAVRVNMVTIMMVIAIIVIETQPIAALLAAIATAWLMFRFNMGKEGGKTCQR